MGTYFIFFVVRCRRPRRPIFCSSASTIDSLLVHAPNDSMVRFGPPFTTLFFVHVRTPTYRTCADKARAPRRPRHRDRLDISCQVEFNRSIARSIVIQDLSLSCSKPLRFAFFRFVSGRFMGRSHVKIQTSKTDSIDSSSSIPCTLI